MMTAHINKEAIALRFDVAENLSHQSWEELLDQLRSEHIPSLYQHRKRSHASIEPGSGKTLVVIYLTPKMVSVEQAEGILRHRNIDVHVEAENR
jgi:hypothetical protein